MNITEQQMITTYLNYSMPLCAVLWNDNLNSWKYEHFTNLYLMRDKTTNYIWYDFLEDEEYMSDIANYGYLRAEDQDPNDDFITMVKKYIDEENYTTVFMDAYYYKESSDYQKVHSEFSLLIYGYDDEKQQFYAIGFNKIKHLGLVNIDYGDLEKGIKVCLANYEKMGIWVNWYFFTLHKLKNKDEVYKYNPQLFMDELKNFAHSTDQQSRLRREIIKERGNKAIYGISTQYEYVKGLRELAAGNFVTDYRHIHIITEQKKFLVEKLDFVLPDLGMEKLKEEILPSFKELFNLYNTQRILVLKTALKNTGNMYGQLKDKDTINLIADQIEHITEKEEALYKKIF